MITRIAFDREFVQAIRIRGLTLTELAKRAGVNIATASAAVHGRPLNVTTATRLARAVAAAPAIPELEAWAVAPAERVVAEALAPWAAEAVPLALVRVAGRRLSRPRGGTRGDGQLRMDIG